VKISPMTLPNVTAARQNLPEASVAAPRNERAEAAKTDPASVRASPPVFSTLSSETNWSLVQATQEEPSAPEHGKSPAHAARALIEANPDLAGQPFGKVVSMLARGLTPTAPAEEESVLPPQPTTEVETPPAESQAPEVIENAETPETPPAPAMTSPTEGETALALLAPPDEGGTPEETPSLLDLVAQAGLAAPTETDPTDLLDPA